MLNFGNMRNLSQQLGISAALCGMAYGIGSLGSTAVYAQSSSVIIAQKSAPQMYSTVSVDELEAIIKSTGFVYRKESERIIRFDAGSYKMFASLESCEGNTGNQCRAVVLGTFFKYQPSLSVINEWNRTRYGSTAYIDKDNDAALESSITLVGGITEDNFKANILVFVARVNQFSKYIGFGQ